MDRPTKLSLAASVLALWCSAAAPAAPAAPESLERQLESAEYLCGTLDPKHALAGVPRGGYEDLDEPLSERLDRSMRAAGNAMRSQSRTAAQRAAAQRACAQAAELRAELAFWVDRPASPREAVWEAVVTRVWQRSGPPPAYLDARRSSSYAKRYEKGLDDLFDAIDISKHDRDAITAYVTGMMEQYFAVTAASRQALCARADEIKTGAELSEALAEGELRAAAAKEQLVDAMLKDLNLASAAKIIAYAVETAPTVSVSNGERYANLTAEQIADLLDSLCR